MDEFNRKSKSNCSYLKYLFSKNYGNNYFFEIASVTIFEIFDMIYETTISFIHSRKISSEEQCAFF